jgi:serine/threonine protein kinase
MSEKDFFDQFKYDPEKDLLGSGGFGSVYRAYDRLKDRYVAIKISQVKDIFGKFTLLNEVKLSQEIDDHTNVARYEFGLRVKHPFPVDFAVMAYYEEGNLDMVLRDKHGILSKNEQYDIVEGLLEGIGHLHTENVIHRDLKLANILMHRTRQGQWRPKIADFGLSRQMDNYDASIANSAIGITIAYAAPEQIENKPIRKNVDLWALGVIIYRILTGEMPFAPIQDADPTSATVEMSRKITQVELPEKLNILAEPYQSIIKRCWVKDTKERAQSTSELLDILKDKRFAATIKKNSVEASSTGRKLPPSVWEASKAKEAEPPVEEVTSLDIQPIINKIEPPIEAATSLEIAPIFEHKEKGIDPSVPKPIPPQKIDLSIDEATSLERATTREGTDKTVIETAFNQTTKTASWRENIADNKGKIAVMSGLLALLLSFGICNRKAQNGINQAVVETPVEVPKTETPTTPNAQQPTVAPNSDVPKTDKTERVATNKPAQTTEKTASRSDKPVDYAGDFLLKLSCCCPELTGGTITIKNFGIEADGHVSTLSNTSVSVTNNGQAVSDNPVCQDRILAVFKKYYKWQGTGSYASMARYSIEF